MPDHSRVKTELPPIPAKRYFTIGEVSELCAVKPHVLRYWEQEFAQLKPVKRRGNRRYYQHHEVLLIRRIRDLLYEQGFTINGARHRLESETASQTHAAAESGWLDARKHDARPMNVEIRPNSGWTNANLPDPVEIRQELEEIRQLLGYDS
jgi:DNA-binding transcriptional MerR regulator